MNKYEKPYIIEFPKIGNSAVGYISVAENSKNIPFEIKRVFWTYFTPEELTRGHHAHYKTEQILIAVSGKIIVHTEMPDGSKEQYLLDKPHLGLYLPPYCWHYMEYSHTAVQLVLASELYIEADYIRSYNQYKEVYV
ncbi:MAG: FdtA/QdtA family cupin domain-containing protein [Bacteroidia bacterium]|nr:FdtA/QdtA family cupin domain-containing protein [Bacteroidia bacterium]